ncbi:hypothetical protein BDZ89DRAFT_1037307 [Hymenopellis radicata]|nr:hypothetical protein BDZ89DRAFT_1037307 [Hymenopellis radicata]
MQFKLSVLTTVGLAALAAASLLRLCCNSLSSASVPSTAALLGLLGIAVESVTGQVGLTCSPSKSLVLEGLAAPPSPSAARTTLTAESSPLVASPLASESLAVKPVAALARVIVNWLCFRVLGRIDS